MRILAIISGDYGRRHVDNIRAHGPEDWQIEVWRAPAVLPPIVDYPEDHLPEHLPDSDLILSFAEIKGVAELLPDIARMTGARAVIAAVDNEAWLPRGLARPGGRGHRGDGGGDGLSGGGTAGVAGTGDQCTGLRGG